MAVSGLCLLLGLIALTYGGYKAGELILCWLPVFLLGVGIYSLAEVQEKKANERKEMERRLIADREEADRRKTQARKVEAQQIAAEQRRIREMETRRQQLRVELVHTLTDSQNNLNSLPSLIKGAEAELNLADTEFAEKAAISFWDAVERATNCLARYQSRIAEAHGQRHFLREDAKRTWRASCSLQFEPVHSA